MSKPTAKLPPPYVEKMQAIVNAELTSDVVRRFKISKQTFHSVLKRGRASELTIERLNPFFTSYGDDADRLPRLEYERLKRAEMAPQKTGELSEVKPVQADRMNLTGDPWRDPWRDIRALYLDRRNDEALMLAHSGLLSNDIETRLTAAQSLLYLNHRLGRLSAMASAANALRRTATDHLNLFPKPDRIRTVIDIAKCLCTHGHPLLAARLFNGLEEYCRPSSKFVPAHITASLMRGVSECRYFQGQPEPAYRAIKLAVNLGSDGAATGDDSLSHANLVAFYSTERSTGVDRHWTNLAGKLSSLEVCLRQSSKMRSDDGAIPSGVSLITLIGVLVMSAFSCPHLNKSAILELLDQRAEDLFRSGLADHKVLPIGIDKLLIEQLPHGQPARRILGAMVKDRMYGGDARDLYQLAQELLDSAV